MREKWKIFNQIQDQKNQLIKYGVLENNIYEAESTIENRPVFRQLLFNTLKESDEIVVIKLDRCSSSTLDFLKIQEELIKRKIKFKALDLAEWSNYLATNKFIVTTLSAIANFENERRKECQAIGIEAAKKNRSTEFLKWELITFKKRKTLNLKPELYFYVG